MNPTDYTYDALDRLTGVTSPWVTLGYAYDANGNRLTRTENGKTGTYSYAPESNRMMKINKKAVTLDAAGNTVADRNGNRVFDYDSAGHLKQISVNGETRGVYAYNAIHQRTRKVKRNGGTFLYHYDLEGRLISEIRNGQPWKDYLWADDGPIVQIKVHKNVRGRLFAKDVVYLTSDHLNTPRIGTDANVQVVWRWEGDAFGDTKTENDPDEDDKNVTVNLRFPGQYYDAETGLHYNWHRYYDPKTGRYITSDPIGLAGGINTYTYVGNNPLTRIDPLGLDWRNWFPLPSPGGVWNYWSDLYNTSRDLRGWGHQQHPGEQNSSMRHCVVSCLVADQFTVPGAFVAGSGNEVQGLILHDIPDIWGRVSGKRPWAFSPQDFRDNQRGFNCSKQNQCGNSGESSQAACIRCCQQ